MSSIFRPLLPGYTLPSVAAKGSLAVIRDRILQTMLLGLVAMALPIIYLATASVIRVGKWGLAALYIGLFLILFLITILRKLPYTLRSLIVIGMVYILAFSEFFDSSLPGELRFYLTIFCTLTASLLGYIPGLVSILIGFLTLLVTGLGVSNNLIVLHDMDLFLRSPNWLNGLFTYLLLAGGVTLSITALVNGLQSGLKEKEELAANLEKQRGVLEDTVQSRTADIQRRLMQVRTAAEISRAISRLNTPESLFMQVAELVRERFDLYYVGIFLTEPSGRYAVLRAGTGEAGQAMLNQNHRLAIGGNSMIGWAIANRQPRIALDVGEEAVRFNNPFLPNTRSEVALPILSRSDVLGAISFQSDRSRAFDQNDILVLQGIADSLAVAIENANLFSELSENLEEIRALNRNYIQKAWTEVITTTGELEFEYEGSAPTRQEQPAHTIQVPLVLRDQVIGQVTLETDRDQLTEEDAAYLNAVTTQTAVALENARLVQESEWRAFQERKLNEMTAAFHQASSLDAILKSAVEQLGQLPSVAEVSIQLVAPEALSNEVHRTDGKEKLA